MKFDKDMMNSMMGQRISLFMVGSGINRIGSRNCDYAGDLIQANDHLMIIEERMPEYTDKRYIDMEKIESIKCDIKDRVWKKVKEDKV